MKRLFYLKRILGIDSAPFGIASSMAPKYRTKAAPKAPTRTLRRQPTPVVARQIPKDNFRSFTDEDKFIRVLGQPPKTLFEKIIDDLHKKKRVELKIGGFVLPPKGSQVGTRFVTVQRVHGRWRWRWRWRWR